MWKGSRVARAVVVKVLAANLLLGCTADPFRWSLGVGNPDVLGPPFQYGVGSSIWNGLERGSDVSCLEVRKLYESVDGFVDPPLGVHATDLENENDCLQRLCPPGAPTIVSGYVEACESAMGENCEFRGAVSARIYGNSGCWFVCSEGVEGDLGHAVDLGSVTAAPIDCLLETAP